MTPKEFLATRTLGEAARECASFAVDVGRALQVLPAVERCRSAGMPEHALSALRARGARAAARTPRGETSLGRAIRYVDRFSPGGGNCLRRTLLRVALDPEAAKQPVVLGLNVSEARRGTRSDASGHAWVGEGEASGRYEVEFRV
jgi:hypothetical protein